MRTTNYGYVQVYGYKPKSMATGLACGLRRTPAMSATTAPLRRHNNNNNNKHICKAPKGRNFRDACGSRLCVLVKELTK